MGSPKQELLLTRGAALGSLRGEYLSIDQCPEGMFAFLDNVQRVTRVRNFIPNWFHLHRHAASDS